MKLPVLSAREVIKALEKDGFKELRQKGSHISLYKKSGNKTYLTIVLNKKEIKKGTLLGILKKAGISKEKFIELLNK